MAEIRVEFKSDSLTLEGVLATPDGAGPFPAVIVCHPHPLYGGSMDNNVVDGLCAGLARQSLASLKFNFRGVGGSQGSFAHGAGEQRDVSAALAYITTVHEIDTGRIGLAGYSAGAASPCQPAFRMPA